MAVTLKVFEQAINDEGSLALQPSQRVARAQELQVIDLLIFHVVNNLCYRNTCQH